MHFRHVLISGLMVAAALSLPDQAFAEKNEIRGQQQRCENISLPSQTIAAPASVPAQAEKAQPQEKTIVPAAAVEKRQAPIDTPSNAETPKPVQEVRKMPEHAKANSFVTKEEKMTGLEKAAAVKEDARKDKQLSKTAAVTDREVLHDAGTEGKNKTPLLLPAQNIKSVKSEQKKPFDFKEQALPKQQDAPNSKKEEIPKAYQLLNQTQRTSSSGGKSNDRTGLGQGTMSLMDKIFEWDYHDDLLLVEIYFSRQEFMIHQWVNAPPSPPPQEAPFLKK